MDSQVVSKHRVAEHGEVLTGTREVEAMLELVEQECDRIEARFLEPACGNGNFMAAVLKRKLAVVAKRYSKSQLEFERNALLATSSIYGIDILEDNVRQCRGRLFEVFDGQFYTPLFKASSKEKYRAAIKFILERNVIWGDALTLRTVGTNANYIIFSEWSPVNGSHVKRRDFAFRELMTQQSLLKPRMRSDLGNEVFIPTPEKEFAPVHFLDIPNAQGE
jgi:hypothetical protein